ncbi:hypothetical protein ZWY2020_043412 [Hordeum vulgare]|nr:hypothetical protein ZWY2020_043412 [Hordeum vulgare]
MLRLCTCFHKIELRLHKLRVSVKEAFEVAKPEFSLSHVIVTISRLSSEDKLDFILKMVSKPIGKMVAVDVGSLEDDGPARIQVLCMDQARIDDLIPPFYLTL